jgi:hypothetical protein
MKRRSSLLLYLTVGLIASTLPAAANHVPNPLITGSATAYDPNYTAVNVFDTGAAEYATRSQGAVSTPFTTNPNDGTWVQFDFATTVTLNQFVMVTRANAADIIGTSRLIVSPDSVFDNSDTIFTFNNTGFNQSGVIQNLNPVSGRYARWEVLSSIGSSPNLGARQMYFLNIPSGHVLLPAPVAINSSPPFNASYAASLAVNGNAGDDGHEYASAGAGANMFIDFDFGRTFPISGFDFWNRMFDQVTAHNLIFANTADFSSPIATLPFTASVNGNQINSATFAPITARYVRFQATAILGGVNTGMREIQFYTPAGQPPFVSQQPQGGTRLAGDSFTFTVGVGGDTPRFYQWWKQTTPLDDATNASLTLTNLQLSDSGDYHVVVSNAFGTATSDPATLTVIDPPVDITSNLRAWFRMDDGTFLTAADSSGNGNNGMLEGFVDDDSQWVAGRIDGGLRFNPAGDGMNEVVRVPDTGQLDFSAVPEFTLAAWVRANSAQADNGAGVIARGVGGGGEQYAIDVFNGTYRFFVRDAAQNAAVAHGGVRANGTWQHVVAVYSRSLNRMKLYVNTHEVTSATPFAGTLLANAHDVGIGARKNAASPNYDLNLDGIVDDVRIYARALTPGDVAALYAEAAPVGPIIVQHPQPTFAGVGDSVVFTVVVDGTVPLSYQWRKNGTAIPGATNDTLVIANAQLSDDANYSVVVENTEGSATSTDARLTVVPFLDLRMAPVQASSEFSPDYPARNAFDRLKLSTGPNTARWASAPSGAPHWIYVDLGRDLAIRRVTLDFDPACGRDFFLRYRKDADGPSPNPDEWQAIAQVTGYSQGGSQGIDGPDVFYDFLESRLHMPGNVASGAVASIGTNIFIGRYLMLHITATESPPFAHVSVWEMQVDAISSETRIRSIALDNNGAKLSFRGIPKRNYDVQRATNLDGTWTSLEVIPASDDGLGEYVDPDPPEPMGFYRLVSPN